MFAEVSSLLVIYFSRAFSQPRRETPVALLLRCIVEWPHHLTAFFLPETFLQVPVRTEGSSGPFCKSCTTSPSCQYLQPVLGGSPGLWIRRRVPLAKVRRKPQGRQYMGEVVLEPCGSIHFCGQISLEESQRHTQVLHGKLQSRRQQAHRRGEHWNLKGSLSGGLPGIRTVCTT